MNNLMNPIDAMECGVYKIESHGEIYIGSTRDSFTSRFNAHRGQFNSDRHRNKKLMAYWNKYGALFSILEICDSEKAFEREQHYIDKLQPGLNMQKRVTLTAPPASYKGLVDWNTRKNTELLLLLMKIGLLKTFSEWSGPVRVFFGLPWPKKLSQETIYRMSVPRGPNANTGRRKSEEHKKSIGIGRYRYIQRMKDAGLWPPAFYQRKTAFY